MEPHAVPESAPELPEDEDDEAAFLFLRDLAATLLANEADMELDPSALL